MRNSRINAHNIIFPHSSPFLFISTCIMIYAVTCHTASFVSCQPCVTQQAESPAHGHDFTGRLSPHFPHWLALIALICPRTRASSWRISRAMYSLSSYGSLPGRRSAQFRASISISCSSRTNSSLRSPASAWRARCAALRSAAVLAMEFSLPAFQADC